MTTTQRVSRIAFQAELKKIIRDELAGGDLDGNKRITKDECGYVQGFVRVVWGQHGRGRTPIDAIATLAEKKASTVWSELVGNKRTVSKADVAIVKRGDKLLGELAQRALRTAALRAEGELPQEAVKVSKLPRSHAVARTLAPIAAEWGDANITSSHLELFGGVLSARGELDACALGGAVRQLFTEKMSASEGRAPDLLPRAKELPVAAALKAAAANVNTEGFCYAPKFEGRREVERQLEKLVRLLGSAAELSAVKVAGKFHSDVTDSEGLVSLYLFANRSTGAFVATYVREGSM